MKAFMLRLTFLLLLIAAVRSGNDEYDFAIHGKCLHPCDPKGYPPRCRLGCRCYHYGPYVGLCMKIGIPPPEGWRPVSVTQNGISTKMSTRLQMLPLRPYCGSCA
uniref:Putative secreted protein n=1 Tax=Amblyomma triste TaxID=251400 RepID=A0A023G0F5_AMBTT